MNATTARRCVKATFTTPQAAAAKRRELMRGYKIATSASYCATCDMYHLSTGEPQGKLRKSWVLILKLVGQGYTDQEIAGILNMSFRTVTTYVEMMKRHFYALSRANLVLIAASIGLIDINEFVPSVGEHKP